MVDPSIAGGGFGGWVGLAMGLALGVLLANRKWREKGDHEYMNTMASGRHLYTVKRQGEDEHG